MGIALFLALVGVTLICIYCKPKNSKTRFGEEDDPFERYPDSHKMGG